MLASFSGSARPPAAYTATALGKSRRACGLPASNQMNIIKLSKRAMPLRFAVACLAVSAAVTVAAQASTERFNRPIPMGVSVGNTPSLPYIYAGTAGLLVQEIGDSNTIYILSNNHVLGVKGPSLCPNTADKGTTWTLQPGTLDIGTDPGNDPYYQVGVVSDYVPITLKRWARNFVDAAISLTDSSLARTQILGIGQPASQVGTPTVGENVTKSGRTTGVTTGTVEAVNVTVQVAYQVAYEVCGVARFLHQVSITPGTFSAGGDSGSAILDQGTKKPVALLFAGDNTRTLGSPMSTVLDELGVAIYPAAASAMGDEMMTEDPVPALDPALAPLAEIQARHEDRLFAIPGVVGMGIGQTEDGTAAAFIVYTEKKLAAKSRAQIPAFLEGIPLRIIQSGGFVAY
jgi:hypothetical protein